MPNSGLIVSFRLVPSCEFVVMLHDYCFMYLKILFLVAKELTSLKSSIMDFLDGFTVFIRNNFVF